MHGIQIFIFRYLIIHIFPSPSKHHRGVSRCLEKCEGATLCPGLARSGAQHHAYHSPSSDAADIFQNMSSSSNAKVYHGMIRVFSYTFATTLLKIHNPSRTCTHVGRYLQIVIFLKVDGKSKIFMNTNMPHDSQ